MLRAKAEDATDRKISALDILIVEVFGEKDLSVERRVQAGGTITYPLLGSVEVAGRTPGEVESILTEKLKADYLVDPAVTVMVKEYRTRTVSVMGRVQRSGAIELPAEYRIDLLEAIARAGGLDNLANRNKIQLNRGGKITFYKFDDLVKINDTKKKVWVEQGDVIYVHEAKF